MTGPDIPEQRDPLDEGGQLPPSSPGDVPTPASPGDEAADAAPQGDDAATPSDPREEEIASLRAQLDERTGDLQRLQAEYVNYRKRVDRDRLVARDLTVVAFVEAFLPLLDDLDSARQHGELTEGTPLAAMAEKFEGVLAKFGWERFGVKGEAFDPTVHEALMHSHSQDVTETTVGEVLQPGHRAGERIVRAARVVAVDPEE